MTKEGQGQISGQVIFAAPEGPIPQAEFEIQGGCFDGSPYVQFPLKGRYNEMMPYQVTHACIFSVDILSQ